MVENEICEMMLFKNKVMDVEIVDVFLWWMGIFVVWMFEGECEKLLCMEDVFYKWVVG